MDWYERVLEVSVHYEVRVRQPDIIVMMNRIQELVLRPIAVP